MTTLREIDVRCAVCGALSRKVALGRTSSFGPPDLDLRPQGPARWALEFSVQRCEACGYCSRSLGQAPPRAQELVESNVYRDVLQRSKLPALARSLFCAALVNEFAGEPEGSGWRFLESAWACDDAGAGEQSRLCRERAAEMFSVALETGAIELSPPVAHTLIADIWRRATRFDEAVRSASEAQELLAGDALDPDDGGNGASVVATYIRELAEAGDDSCHSAADAFARGE